MKIGELARLAGSTSGTVRYYERIGLLPRAGRTDSNYRDYGEDDVERLAFIRHARSLGFELDDVRSLLDLAAAAGADCGGVDAIAQRHLDNVGAKIASLQALERELRDTLEQCRGGAISSCRIIGALKDHSGCGTRHGRQHGEVRTRPQRPTAVNHQLLD